MVGLILDMWDPHVVLSLFFFPLPLPFPFPRRWCDLATAVAASYARLLLAKHSSRPPHATTRRGSLAVPRRRARRAATPSAARRSATSAALESTTSTAARRSSTSAVAAHWSCATTALRRLVARTEGAARPHRSPATKSARRVTNEVGRSDSFVSEESLEPASSWHIPYGGQTQTS